MSGPRVLFVGVYRDGTGWGNAATEYIRALHTAGVEVAARPLKLNELRVEVPELVRALEKNRFDSYDAVIQNVLPHHMDYNGRFPKNIGLYFVETSNFSASSWADNINMLDEAWVCCDHNKIASQSSGVAVPTHVYPIPVDVTRFERSYKKLSLREKMGDNFVFYTIGEYNRRKNLAALLKAFHTEFDLNEPVSLVIKTTAKPGKTDYATKEEVEQFCHFIKDGMKLYPSSDHYKEEVVIVGRFSGEEILMLHESCDCFVSPSYGEAWCMPAFDAMGMGKTPIVTGWGGFTQYMDNECGWLVPYHYEQVFGTQNDTFTDIHTGREHWASVGIYELRHAMREAFENRELRKRKALNGKDRVYDFTYEKVGRGMRHGIGA